LSFQGSSWPFDLQLLTHNPLLNLQRTYQLLHYLSLCKQIRGLEKKFTPNVWKLRDNAAFNKGGEDQLEKEGIIPTILP